MSLADPVSQPDELTPERVGLVRDHLKEITASQAFAGSKRAQDFLRLIVEHALARRFDDLRERMIGAEMFGRPVDYDTANDAVVRVKATEVRKKLAQYYRELAKPPTVRIDIPPGTYVPKFHWDSLEEPAASGPQAASILPEPPSIPPAQEQPSPQPTVPPPVALERRRRLPARWLAFAAGLLLLAVIGYFTFKASSNRSAVSREIHSIAILPLQNLSGDPRQDYFADGMTDELITDLGQVSGLRVISRTSVMTYKGTKKMLPEIARELGVDAVVEGSVVREGNQVRITAQLIDGKTDRHIWANSYVRDVTSVLALQGAVAQAIADQVSIKMTPQEQARLTRVRPINAEAQDLYLLGVHMLNAGEPRKAVDYLQQSIAQYAGFAPAHAALANAYGWLGEAGWLPYSEAFVRQKEEASKAIELDDALPEGHAELAGAEMNLNWAWDTAEHELKRALALNPSLASVHATYAFYLERMGRTPEGLAEIKRDITLDPVSNRSFMNAGFADYFARRYNAALANTQRAYSIEPNPAVFYFPFGVIYAEKGDYAKAIQNFQGLGEQPHALGHLGNLYARMGRAADARAILPKVEQHIEKTGVGRYEIALVYAGLNEKDQAFAWLEKALASHDKGLTYLKIDPCLDPLRSDPRFHELLRRVGLPL
ncbi:MAG: TPR end-of-group domain-containing protein [Candidatus Sulfotelmatobacter sp.]